MGPDLSACQRGEPQTAQVCLRRFRSASVRGTPSLSTTCAVQSGQQGTRKGSPVSSSRTSLPFETAHRSMTAAFQRYDSLYHECSVNRDRDKHKIVRCDPAWKSIITSGV